MSLERFREAQKSPSAGFDTALDELRAGGKRSHWIWYIFPQLDGLGVSGPSRTFALSGTEEAAEFLRDPQLRSRLLTIAGEVRDQVRARRAPSIRALMGSEIDARKVVSSLTLFRHVARTLSDRDGDPEYAEIARVADDVLTMAAEEGYPPCVFTLRRVDR